MTHLVDQLIDSACDDIRRRKEQGVKIKQETDRQMEVDRLRRAVRNGLMKKAAERKRSA